jgi:hypothetical protein
MTLSYSWHRLIAGISHTRRLYGSGPSSGHATASRPMVQGLRPAYRFLRVPWLLCSSLTVAVRHSFSYAVQARELYYNSEPRSSNPYVREHPRHQCRLSQGDACGRCLRYRASSEDSDRPFMVHGTLHMGTLRCLSGPRAHFYWPPVPS